MRDEHGKAITHYRAALELDPDFAIAHLNLALLLGTRLGRWHLACNHMTKAVELGIESARPNLAEYERMKHDTNRTDPMSMDEMDAFRAAAAGEAGAQ